MARWPFGTARGIALPPLSALAFAILVAGCYLSHTREPARAVRDAEPPSSRSMSDAGPPSPRPMIDAELPLDPVVDAGVVPDATRPDAEITFARPSEELDCDGGDEALLERCGPLVPVYVAAGGRSGAIGSPDDPFGTLADAVSVCGARCDIRIASGELAIGSFVAPECAWISGGWSRGVGAWSRGGEPTTIRTDDSAGNSDDHAVGAITAGRRLVIENVRVERPITALSGGPQTDLLVVRNVSIAASYTGIVLDGGTGLRVCGTRIEAGYEGISVAWEASDVIIDDVDIDADYSGIGIAWSSSRVLIRSSRVRGGYDGVGISWSSHDITIESSTIEGDYEGIGVAWDSHHVSIDGNTVLGCYEPIHVGTGSFDVKVTATTTGACAAGTWDG